MDVRLALGGHPPPLVLRADGSVEALGAFGTILGATPDAVLSDVAVRLAPGDVLVLYTDGVTEAGVRTDPLGQEGLADLLREPRRRVAGGGRRRGRAGGRRRPAGRAARRHRGRRL